MDHSTAQLSGAKAAQDEGSKTESENAIARAWSQFLDLVANGRGHISAATQSNLLSLYPGMLFCLNWLILAFLLFISVIVLGLLFKRKALQVSDSLCATTACERLTLFCLMDVASIVVLFLAISSMTTLMNEGKGPWGVKLTDAIVNAGSSLDLLSSNASALLSTLLRYAVTKKPQLTSNANKYADCFQKMNATTSNRSEEPLMLLREFALQMKETAKLLKNFDALHTQPNRPLLYTMLALFQTYKPYWSAIGLLLFLLILIAAVLATLTHAAYCFQENENTRKVFAPTIAWISRLPIGLLLQTFWIHLSVSVAICNLLAIPVVMGKFTAAELCQYAPRQANSEGPAPFTLHEIAVNAMWLIHRESYVPSRRVSAIHVIRHCKSSSFMAATKTDTKILKDKLNKVSKEYCENSTTVASFIEDYESLLESQKCTSLNEAQKNIDEAICSGGEAVYSYWTRINVITVFGLLLIAITYVLQSRMPVINLKIKVEKEAKPAQNRETIKVISVAENQEVSKAVEIKIESEADESRDQESTEQEDSNYEEDELDDEDEDEDDEKAMGECEYFSAQEAVVAMSESPYIDSREIEMLNLKDFAVPK